MFVAIAQNGLNLLAVQSYYQQMAIGAVLILAVNLHWLPSTAYMTGEESFGELMRMKEEGLIRAAGVSNFEPEQIRGALKAGPVDALQVGDAEDEDEVPVEPGVKVSVIDDL